VRALASLPRDDDYVVVVAGAWVASIVSEALASVAMQTVGAGRAAQRRSEAEHHRAEWKTMRDASPDDPPTKAEAARAIAADCVRHERRCKERTVRDHLKEKSAR
jgi:hypothetical protein